MKHLLIVLSLSLSTAGCTPYAAGLPSPLKPSSERSSANAQCNSTPCGNTAAGEDPQDNAIREGTMVRNGTDESRWDSTIYSTSTRPERLELHLIKAANFKLRLLPDSGHLRFELPASVDEFTIEPHKGSPDSICPEYNINVINASRTYAIVQKSCRLFEYKPRRYSMGSTFYLYDLPTHVMRVLWESQTNGKDDPFPEPDTKPKVMPLTNGYNIDWTGHYSSEGTVHKLSVHNRYTRIYEPGNNASTLQCTDMSQSGKKAVESGTCEGAMIPHAVSKP
jgi:hypothetical protein